MKFLSVCSGIEAASVAWQDWEAVAFSEIEKFPSQVLAHHYPDVPNWGDMTKFKDWPDANVDVFVGGTPCQSFSVAGLRKGLDDPRGNLMLTYLAIAAKYRPQWVVWENVPGVLSSSGGRDFASFLRGLGECGYGFAYRVLDAQYFGVPQRRRRVFVVGCFGSWQRAAAVLFERHSLQGHPAPSREKRQGITTSTRESASVGSLCARTGLSKSVQDAEQGHLMSVKIWPAEVSSTLDTTFGTKQGLENQHVNAGCPMFVPAEMTTVQPIAIQGNLIGRDAGGPQGVGASEGVMYTLTKTDVHGVAQPIPINTMVALRHNSLGESTGFGIGNPGDLAYTLTKGHHHAVAQPMVVHGAQDPCTSDIAFTQGRNNGGKNVLMQAITQPIGWSEELTAIEGLQPTLQHGGEGGRHDGVMTQAMAVRRLTPVECERLQGFPDGYTDIQPKGKPTPDGPRYKALGNSMAVPVMRWIGQRIEVVDRIK